MQIRTQFPVQLLSGHDGQPGGLVYLKSNGLQLARAFVTPANPDTTDQNAIRAYLTAAAQAFGQLSDPERAAWRAFAQAHPRVKLGTDYTMQEMAAYVWVNALRQIDGQAITDTAPTTDPDWSITSVSSVAYVVATTILTITYVHTKAVVAGEFTLARITAALNSQQRRARRSDFRLAGGVSTKSIVALSASPHALTVTAPIHTWTTGQWIEVELVPVNSTYVPGTAYKAHVQITVT